MDSKAKIWVVDDERIIRITLADELKDEGFKVREFSNATAVLTSIRDEHPDIIITDIKMPKMSGIELLKKIKEINPSIQVIVMTAHGSIENAVEAMKIGAYDYILKPFKADEIFLVLNRICELRSIKNENVALRKQIGEHYDFSSYIGDRELNNELFKLIQKVSESDSTVLLTGETGTGKELITNIIHYNSNRKKKPFIKVSCAILSKEIFESELFGHVKGAFTGADSDKLGRFELANEGTLYFDDIDDMPLSLQVKLLRALEEREIEKVGSAKTVPIDVRIIASTKKDLRKLVDKGLFREDLFYRLNIFPINLVPLRNRKKDIKLFIDYFVSQFSENRIVSIDQEVYEELENYNWPGNVREIRNISERMTLLSNNNHIRLPQVPIEIYTSGRIDIDYQEMNTSLESKLKEVEIKYINFALKKCNNNKAKAASLLRIPPTTLHSKMNKYNLH
jgi:DNA-binding NtrC family response regulator